MSESEKGATPVLKNVTVAIEYTLGDKFVRDSITLGDENGDLDKDWLANALVFGRYTRAYKWAVEALAKTLMEPLSKRGDESETEKCP